MPREGSRGQGIPGYTTSRPRAPPVCSGPAQRNYDARSRSSKPWGRGAVDQRRSEAVLAGEPAPTPEGGPRDPVGEAAMAEPVLPSESESEDAAAELREAAKSGDLDLVKKLRGDGGAWDETTCAAATEVGHLEVLQWLRAEGCPWDWRTCNGAVKSAGVAGEDGAEVADEEGADEVHDQADDLKPSLLANVGDAEMSEQEDDSHDDETALMPRDAHDLFD